MLADHHPVTHQKELRNTQTTPDDSQYNIEWPEIKNISKSVPANTDQPEEKCAHHTVHFIGAQDQSDTGSLTTQAPLSSSIRATINALSSWISAVQPRESWYLAGWIKDSPIDFLVDPGAVVSTLSLQCYERLADAGSIHTPLKELHMELQAANRAHIVCANSDNYKLFERSLRQECYSRQNNIRFEGVVEGDDENTEQIIRENMSTMKLDVDIVMSACHRYGPRRGHGKTKGPRPIIAQFVRRIERYKYVD